MHNRTLHCARKHNTHNHKHCAHMPSRARARMFARAHIFCCLVSIACARDCRRCLVTLDAKPHLFAGVSRCSLMALHPPPRQRRTASGAMAGVEIAKRCDRLQFLLCIAPKHGCACIAFSSRHGPTACARAASCAACCGRFRAAWSASRCALCVCCL